MICEGGTAFGHAHGVAVDLPVLVLNLNYEPLGVCTARRAVGLLLVGKARMVLNGRGVLRAAQGTIPLPSVIRLTYYVHRPRPTIPLTKREIFRRDNYTCQYCGRQGGKLTLDHVIPRHRGGTFSWENLVTACAACNQRKGDRTPEEAGMPLLRPPGPPPQSALYRFQRYLEEHAEWRPFLEGW